MSKVFSGQNSLAGQIVLLVEDDARGSSDAEELLRKAGANVVLAGNYYQAMVVARLHEPTAAVLDVGLGQQAIDCICAHLRSHAVPYLFVVRSSGGALCGHWRSAPPLREPFAKSELIAGLVRLLACSDWSPD